MKCTFEVDMPYSFVFFLEGQKVPKVKVGIFLEGAQIKKGCMLQVASCDSALTVREQSRRTERFFLHNFGYTLVLETKFWLIMTC